MNTKAQAIINRLSLRKPQVDSLEILAKLVDVLELRKSTDSTSELSKVQTLYPTCSDFERDFPSVCFSLATGVGKTRLMGAFISYLYATKGIKNYFVLAPNLTIYNKLIDDLSNPQSAKYVFRGISDFAVTPPRIITGDNYTEARHDTLFKESVKINIFNISKINSEVRGGKEARIKRLSEYLGESYFNYLSELPDLVLLMDESHHYRADAGLRAINELKPVLGLELTATPIDTKGTKFKNVVFDYPLARALQDGFVKEPAVATRRDFNPDQYRSDPAPLDLIKLEDGMRIHEDTKIALELYSKDTGNRLVRPFVLVVARDTDHAKEIRTVIESSQFFEGKYTGKVMEIHSNQKGTEKEENVQRLIDLEKPENPIEIVVHVNMLKEGWDVTNLYTIIPLRAANSQILTEQTIGRGLRLPYGRRTGVEKVDKLTIIAHDRFQSIVDAANDPHSIIRLENIIEIDPTSFSTSQEVLTSSSVIAAAFAAKRMEVTAITNNEERERAIFALEAKEMITNVVSTLGTSVKSINDLKAPETRKLAMAQVVTQIDRDPQQSLFKTAIIEEVELAYQSVVEEFIERTIPIPIVRYQLTHEVKSGITDFDLDLTGLNYQMVSEQITRYTLRTNEEEIIEGKGTVGAYEGAEKILINELLHYPEIDYDRDTELLYKLVRQAVAKLSEGRSRENLENIVFYHKNSIGKYIYNQLQQHFYVVGTGAEEPIVYPFNTIKPHNYSKYTNDQIYPYTETITPINTIPSKIFGGFKKACHNLYKFDSKAEKDFASILEKDTNVQKWLRPADSQFDLYWKNNSKRYHPDFVVETADTIFMIEIKAEKDVDNTEVQEKADTGKKYCDVITHFNLANGGKKWQYVLIPHTEVVANMSFQRLSE